MKRKGAAKSGRWKGRGLGPAGVEGAGGTTEEGVSAEVSTSASEDSEGSAAVSAVSAGGVEEFESEGRAAASAS